MAKITTWIFLGGDAKKGSWEDVSKKTIGLPVRPLGIVFVLLAGVLIFLVVQFGKGPIMTAVLRDGLERANGATVDLENSEFDFKENKLSITGLAIADASNLDLDILRAAKLEADIGTASLLSKRLNLERVVIDSAKHSAKRTTRAYPVGPPPAVSEPPAPKAEDGDAKTIDDYVKEAKVWKERLAKVKEWLEKLSGPEGEKGRAEPPRPADGEAFEDWLKRQIEIAGYDGVRADHLITAAPTFTIGELLVNDLSIPQLPDEALSVKGLNLTTHPWLLNAEKSIRVTSAKDTLGASIQLGNQSATNNASGFSFHYRGLPTDQVAGSIKFGGEQTLSGGTLDVSAAGTWRQSGGVVIDLPLQVQLHNVTIALPGGAGSQTIESLNIPIGLTGPLDNPRIKVESKAFAEIVKQAALAKGKELLKEKVGSEIEKALGDKVKLPGGTKGLLDSFLGGKK